MLIIYELHTILNQCYIASRMVENVYFVNLVMLVGCLKYAALNARSVIGGLGKVKDQNIPKIKKNCDFWFNVSHLRSKNRFFKKTKAFYTP